MSEQDCTRVCILATQLFKLPQGDVYEASRRLTRASRLRDGGPPLPLWPLPMTTGSDLMERAHALGDDELRALDRILWQVIEISSALGRATGIRWRPGEVTWAVGDGPQVRLAGDGGRTLPVGLDPDLPPGTLPAGVQAELDALAAA